MGEELSKNIQTLLEGSDDIHSKALLLLAQLIENKLGALERQHEEVRDDIEKLHARISTLKGEMEAVRFFSKKPKLLLTVLIALIILLGSGIQNIFSFFAKLL
jgi:uncharacterized coiled-coil DUF342 family protein